VENSDRARRFDLDQNAQLASAIGRSHNIAVRDRHDRRQICAGLIGSALGLAVAVAISHAPDQEDSNALSEARTPAAAVCPKIEWPYGCDWHSETTTLLKHFSLHRINHNRGFLSFFR
jgi:hypothetical protein